MAANSAKKPTGFDLGKLEKMTPPFTIRVERRDQRTQQYEPIPLPQDVWSMEDAKRIEQIVLNDVSGGGSYKAQISDTQGASMQWDFVFPPDYFPQKIAPMAERAAGGPIRVQPSSPPPPPGWVPGMFGTPMAPRAPEIPAYQSPPNPGHGYYPGWMQPQSPAPWWMYQTPPPASTPRNGASPEVDMLRTQLEAVKQQAAEERHLREREQAEARHQQELAALRTQMTSELKELKEALVARPRGDDDPAVQALRAQVEEMRRANDQLARDRERVEAEARHREELRQIQESSQRQIDSLKELVAKVTENRVDPTMQLMIEMQRQQNDTQRESARLSAEQAREASRLASEQPRVVMEMIERAKTASGADQMLLTVGRAYEGVMNMQNRVMETMTQMQGSPGWEMATNALEAGKATLEKFIASKRDQELAKSRTEQYRMQAEAYARAQAQAQAAQAQTEPFRYEDGSIKGQPPQYSQIGGAAAAPANDVQEHEHEGDEGEEESTATNGKQPREAEIFGPIYDDVVQLRQLVKEDEVEPDAVAQAVVQAAVQIQQENVVIPVFSLYADRRYADLMDLILPGSDSQFIAECVQSITKLRAEVEVNS